MKSKNSKKIPQRSKSLAHHTLPVIVWLGAVAGVVLLLYQRTETVVVHGMVKARIYDVASVTTGRIKSIRVGLNETVTQNQLLAVIDTLPEGQDAAKELELQRSTLLAEIEHLQAQIVPIKEQLQAEATRLEQSRVGDDRQFALDVENLQLRILELKAQIEADRIAVDNLALEIPPIQKLVLDNALAPIELQRLQRQQETLIKSIEETQKLLNQSQENLLQAQARRDEFSRQQLELPSADNAAEVIRKAIVVQQRRLQEIDARLEATGIRRNVEIRAPFDGVVSHLYCELNEVADVNAPLMTITKQGSQQVVAYVDQSQVDLVKVGMRVDLVKNTIPPVIANDCEIVSVAPVVEQLPPQLWRHPTTPQWGRLFVVQAPESMPLLAGEKVGIAGLMQ